MIEIIIAKDLNRCQSYFMNGKVTGISQVVLVRVLCQNTPALGCKRLTSRRPVPGQNINYFTKLLQNTDEIPPDDVGFQCYSVQMYQPVLTEPGSAEMAEGTVKGGAVYRVDDEPQTIEPDQVAKAGRHE